jgi:AcrR family transcriptional regulator
MTERIKSAAREQMATRGTAGLSLRAVARELDITAPAIYNYFARLDDLITALIVDAFSALADAMRAAEADVPTPQPADRIEAMALAYREWAVAHPVDFQLIYGNPIPGYVAPAEITAPLALSAFLGMFRWYMSAYSAGQLRVPAEYAQPPKQIETILAQLRQDSGEPVPAEIVALLASSWARIHGLIMLELFEHLQPLVGDPAEFYAYEVRALLQRLGLR